MDFFYLTNNSIPSKIKPNPKLQEDVLLQRRTKSLMDYDQKDTLVKHSNELMNAENYLRQGNFKEAIGRYIEVLGWYKGIGDWETVSYFHHLCLEISRENHYYQGEARALMGLGICEEKVYNTFEAMHFHERAQEKALEHDNKEIVRSISKELVNIYNKIAQEYLDKEDYEHALEFYEKCLGQCDKAEDMMTQSKCHFQIGLIYERMEDLGEAVMNVNRYLEICQEMELKQEQGEAHKKLSELYSKLGQTSAAIRNLEALLNIAFDQKHKEGQAEAALKLGLLNYKEGLIPTSVSYLNKHFELVKNLVKNDRMGA